MGDSGGEGGEGRSLGGSGGRGVAAGGADLGACDGFPAGGYEVWERAGESLACPCRGGGGDLASCHDLGYERPLGFDFFASSRSPRPTFPCPRIRRCRPVEFVVWKEKKNLYIF